MPEEDGKFCSYINILQNGKLNRYIVHLTEQK